MLSIRPPASFVFQCLGLAAAYAVAPSGLQFPALSASSGTSSPVRFYAMRFSSLLHPCLRFFLWVCLLSISALSDRASFAKPMSSCDCYEAVASLEGLSYLLILV